MKNPFKLKCECNKYICYKNRYLDIIGDGIATINWGTFYKCEVNVAKQSEQIKKIRKLIKKGA